MHINNALCYWNPPRKEIHLSRHIAWTNSSAVRIWSLGKVNCNNPIQSNLILRVQEILSASISNNNIKHKQVNLQFLLDLIRSHKQHFDLSSIYQDNY